MRRSLCYFVAIACAVWSLVIPATFQSGVIASSSDAAEAADQAIHLSELESKGNGAALYRLLHPDAKEIAPRSAVVGWYEADFFPLDPQPITEIVEVRFISWEWDVTGQRYRRTAEVDFIQPFGSGSNRTYVEETVRLVKVDGEWRWFFGRSRQFVDEQIARFGGEEKTSESDRDDDERSESTDEGLSGSTRDCTIVEMYPGYPGYRGNITGVMPHWGGVGDYVCLQTLEDYDPQFDRDEVDKDNKRAARQLGIDGSFEDWTWEKWLQIEIQRGLAPQCYLCLAYDTTQFPFPSEHFPDPDDPRLLIGFLFQDTARQRIFQEVASQPSLTYSQGWGDYTLRAEAYMRLGSAANAPEILEEMHEVAEDATTPGSNYYTFMDTYHRVISVGGYIPTPKSVHPLDQTFVITATFEVGLPHMLEMPANQLREAFEQHLNGWIATGYRTSLHAYLERHWGLE